MLNNNKRRGREFVGGSGAILPQKSLKSRDPEISGVFNNLREVLCRRDSDRFYIFKIVVLLHSSSSFNFFFNCSCVPHAKKYLIIVLKCIQAKDT